jgi:hypothetical protein
MKLHYSRQAVAVGLSFSLLVTGEVHAKPIKYNFTEIADTSGNLKVLGIPVINNLGIVGFKAQLDEGGDSLFSSDGNTTTTIADTSSNFSFMGDDVSINDVGTIAFIAGQNRQNPQTVGVYTSDGKTLKTIITTPTTDDNGVGFRANSFEEVSINNTGIVALIESISSRAQVVLIGDGSNTKQISGSASPLLSGLQISDRGNVVFSYYILGIYTGDLNTSPPIATASGFSDGKVDFVTRPSLNNSDTFAYVSGSGNTAKNEVTQSKVLTKKGNTTTTVADTSGDFKSFGTTSINDRRTVAFIANLDAGGEGIFTGNNPKTDKVIATGDSLFGYTVVDLDFASEGLNNSNQITFVATLANNTQVVVRANPRRNSRG